MIRRAHAFFCAVIGVVLLRGCDPAGVPRVQLQLRTQPTQETSVELDSADAQEALRILGGVVAKHDFKLAGKDPRFIRVYSLPRPPVKVNGHVYTRNIPCRVKLTSMGLLVAIGEFGFLSGQPPEVWSLFSDVRSAFIRRYGKDHVRSRKWGDA